MPDTFAVHAHHVYRSHPDLDPEVSSCVLSWYSGLTVAMPCVIQGDQNLFLSDKLNPRELLLPATSRIASECRHRASYQKTV